jgi:dTDP-4-amino-4,6-dideoxygalactose transaminase
MRDWGQAARYYHDHPGFNYRMDGIQGAVLDVKLRHLPESTRKRQEVARYCAELLAGSLIETPAPARDREHVWHVYAIRHTSRDWLQSELNVIGIMTNIHYPCPAHWQKVHADLGYGINSFPVTEALAAETLSLPMYPELGRSQVEHVARTLREITLRQPRDASAA